MADEALNKQLADIEVIGKKQFGEDDWDSNVQRLRQAIGVVPEQVMREVVKDPNAAANIYHAGRDARLQLLQKAQDGRTGDLELAKQLDAEDRAIRQKERDAHAKMKGRR